ncbi:MAG: DUF6431 domain-containing protein [Chloroflexota bacterium]
MPLTNGSLQRERPFSLPSGAKQISFAPILKIRRGRCRQKAWTAHRQAPPKNIVVIVVAFGSEIQKYSKNEGHKLCPRPGQCGHCQTVGRMVGHGSYWRKPKDLTRAWWMRVKRWRCRACRRTTSSLPSFLLPWRHYLVWVIQAVLVRRLEAGGSWAEVVAGCSDRQPGVAPLPAPRTMQRWLKAFSGRAPAWLLAVLGELARQESGSRWLEPRGPTTAGAAQSLLLVSLDLLAWAKKRWSALAGYGVSDRLAFLSHWGNSRRLGRLV